MRRLALLTAIVLLALLAITSSAGAFETYWVCGPGPDVQAHAVAGGVEVTFIPPGAVRLKVRSSRDLALHGLRSESVYTVSTVPLFIAAPPERPVLQLLAKAPWEKTDAYPSLGCMTPKLTAL